VKVLKRVSFIAFVEAVAKETGDTRPLSWEDLIQIDRGPFCLQCNVGSIGNCVVGTVHVKAAQQVEDEN